MSYHSGAGWNATDAGMSSVWLAPPMVIRRPTAADGPAIEAMFARCSFEARYARFLSPRVRIPADYLAGSSHPRRVTKRGSL